ncbi:MAG: sigma 54-interacting transcriptional regulator [Deltaproteobacteria bacterium]|nr:sigma 54-interacting transcriptional regulator [Deltaproteobacteria bacterium]
MEPPKHKREAARAGLETIETFKREKFISKSEKIRQIFQLIEKIARFPDVTVLIEGETGTGKELIAEAIHYLSPRAGGPFITVNSSAIPSGLIETELFGYEGGSFTGGFRQGKKGKFEMANGGTILLDEISELPLEAQTKLLRVLEGKEFFRVGGTRKIRLDVRVIAASNKSLEEAIRAGHFREDLYYRLDVARIGIPPLRERKEDIIPIAMFYIEKLNQKFGRNFRSISEEAKSLLTSHPWKGNVRELKNAIESVLLAENGHVLEARHLSFLRFRRSVRLDKRQDGFPGELPEDGIELESVVKELIRQAVEKCGGNKAKAARLLGISKATLLYRLKKYGLKNTARTRPEFLGQEKKGRSGD